MSFLSKCYLYISIFFDKKLKNILPNYKMVLAFLWEVLVDIKNLYVELFFRFIDLCIWIETEILKPIRTPIIIFFKKWLTYFFDKYFATFFKKTIYDFCIYPIWNIILKTPNLEKNKNFFFKKQIYFNLKNFNYNFTLFNIIYMFLNNKIVFANRIIFKNKIKNNFQKNYLYNGFKNFVKISINWLIPILLSIFVIVFLSYIRCISINKTIFAWIVCLMLFYWLLSTFIFFYKKYLFAKFTSANQRFWKRSLMLFWILELFLFSIFFFLTLNANSEPFYMLDQISLFKYRLSSIRIFLIFLFPYTSLIILTYLFNLNLKWQSFVKNSIFIIFITILLIYIVFNEFYQFFHIINFYSNVTWNYDSEERIWVLEFEARKTRLVNHYVSLLILLKFWHIIFIFFIWIFFVLRVREVKRIYHIFPAINLQNFLFLYIFCWVLLYPWLKNFYRHYFDFSYYWFFVNFRKIGLIIFFNDLKLYWFSIWNFLKSEKLFQSQPFYYWIENSSITEYLYVKQYIKDFFIKIIV